MNPSALQQYSEAARKAIDSKDPNGVAKDYMARDRKIAPEEEAELARRTTAMARDVCTWREKVRADVG